MAAPGPKAKPLELKILEGNRGHRSIDLSATFRPEVGAPDMPKYMPKAARKAWLRLAPEAMRYNLLSRIHGDAFELLCRTIGRLTDLEHAFYAKQNELAKAGKDVTEVYFDTTPNGLKIQSALYQVLSKEQEKLHRLLPTFGLRPDAHANVTRAIAAQLQLFEGGAATPADAPKPTGFSGFE